MTQDDGYSRRRLLQAVAVAGGLGAAGGTVTGAYLSDREVFSESHVGTGEITLELAIDQAGEVGELQSFSEEDFQTDATIEVAFPEIEPGDTGVLRVAHRIGGDQGRLWMQATSSSDTDLGEHLDVRLVRRSACGSEDVETGSLFQGTLEGLITAYADGDLIDEDCIDGQSCLDLEWELIEDVPAELSEESIPCLLDFTAVQCRHTRIHDNPWRETE